MHLVTFERRIEPRSTGDAGSMGGAALGLEGLEEVTHGARRLGALVDRGPHAGSVVDLNRALAIKLALDDSGAPEAEADSLVPADACRFLRSLSFSLSAARTALAFTLDSLDRYDAPDVVRAGVVEPERRVRLRPPVPRPGKVIAVEEGGDVPRFLLVAPSSLGDPRGEIALPVGCGSVRLGVALAAVIGDECGNVREEDALGAVAGYACAITCSAPELGALGHSCDGFTPMGPALVTADEVSDPQGLSVRATISGEPVLSAVAKEMRWPLPELVARASRGVTLEPGDVLLAGLPSPDVRPLRDGDVVELEVQGLGRLRSYVGAAVSGT